MRIRQLTRRTLGTAQHRSASQQGLWTNVFLGFLHRLTSLVPEAYLNITKHVPELKRLSSGAHVSPLESPLHFKLGPEHLLNDVRF